MIRTNWWVLILRGIAAILLSLITFVWPTITLTALVLLFSAFALIDGVLNITAAFRHSESRWTSAASFIQGLAGVVAAVIAIIWPAITALVLVYVVAAWAIVTGVLGIMTAVRLRKQISGEWLLILSGVASVALGILLFLAPGVGALVITLWIGIYALVFGALLIALGLKLRGVDRSLDHGRSVRVPVR